MKKHYMFCLLLALPIFVSGIQHNQQDNLRLSSQSTESRHQQYCRSFRSESRDRSWRLQKIVYYDQSLLSSWSEKVTEYSYNAFQPAKIDEIWIRYHNIDLDVWTNDSCYQFNYNTDLQQIIERQTYSCYNGNHIIARNTADYDTQNRLTDLNGYTTAIDPNLQLANSRVHYIYGANTLNSVVTWMNYGAGTNNFYKSVMTTDTGGRITEQYLFASEDSISWSNSGRYFYTYHPNDTTTGELMIAYLKDSFGENLYEYEYNEYLLKGMVTELLEQDYYNDQWNDAARYIKTYDNNNRLIICIRQTHNSGFWENDWKDIAGYDNNGNLFAIETSLWNADISDWGGAIDRSTYTWEQTTATDDNSVTPVSLSMVVYPNPFRSKLNVSFQSKSNAPIEICIYNVKGQVIKTFVMNKSTTLNWDGNDNTGNQVSNGIYYIKAKQNGQVVSNKLIKMN